MSYHYLLDIALILLSTKVLGLLTKKYQMPQVVGALLAGLIFGPACLNLLSETDFLKQMSELGVIVLMFGAGLETDIQEMKKSGKAAIVIALMGVIIPLLGGFGVATLLSKPEFAVEGTSIVLQNVFIGVILTATSVSITVETLKEMGKLSTAVGNAILGAALIDDILGIIALTIITSLADTSVQIGVVLAKIVLFFVFAAVVGIAFYKVFKKWTMKDDEQRRRYVIVAFAFCLLMAYIAEEYFGVADITGAFLAGL
ncbi:MAG: cation:proton antiporter, partial [Cellulosilyticum sp.]|nr:cation:proton antiporter [Cellulosilyticum sp.]